MIIEAGYDLGMRIMPILRHARRRRGLWIIAMDEDLRELFIERVCSTFEGSVGKHLEEIRKVMSPDGEHWVPKYFALAHGFPDLSDDAATHGWVYNDDDIVRESPELIEFRYLGRVMFDGHWIFSTWPRYSFRDYLGYEDLPRTVVYPGPHGLDCECPACEQMYRVWRAGLRAGDGSEE